MRWGWLGALLMVPCFAGAQNFPVLEGKTEVLAVLPARVIGTGFPGPRAVSADGRYIGWLIGEKSLSDLLQELNLLLTPPSPKVVPPYHLVVYDTERHVSEDRGSVGSGLAVSVDAIGNSGAFIVQTSRLSDDGKTGQRQLILSQAGERALNRALPLGQEEVVEADATSEHFLISVTDRSGRRTKVTVYSSAGQPVFQRESEGQPYLMNGWIFYPGEKGRSEEYDLATGRRGRYPALPQRNEASKKLDWKVTQNSEENSKPTQVDVGFTGEKKTTRLAGAFENLFIDFKDRYLAYSDGDAILIRDIVPMDPAAYAAMKAKRERNALMSRAKQIGTALAIYANDYDDTFPSAGNFEEKVFPYIKIREMLKDFVFLLPGVANTSLSDVSTTRMGFIQGQGGMAVVYADTHVVWVPNKK